MSSIGSKLPNRACVSWFPLILSIPLFSGALTQAQVAVPVGSGSYATSIPATDQFLGGYYSMTAQQVVNQFTNLHLASSITNRPIPSNQWWTDLLVADRSYEPTNGGPRVIQQDPYGGQLWAYPVMLAPNSAGFNLYFPNSWNARSNTNFPVGSFATGPNVPISGSVPLSVGTNDILIADFNQTTYPSGWVTTGTAFGTGPILGGTWTGESPAVQGFLGSSCVNTYRGADTPQGTLTSPTFTISKKYLHVLAGGGADTNNDAVQLLIGTNVVHAAVGNQSGTLSWNTWDLSAYAGQTAQIKIVDTTSGSWGFVLCSWIVASDNGSSPAARYNGSFAPVQSVVTDWSDWGVQFGLPDALGRRMDITLARGVPFVWTTCTGITPVISLGTGTIYDTNGNAITLTSGNNFTATSFAFDDQGRTFGVFAPDNTTFTVAGTTVSAQLSGTNNYLVYGLLPSHTNLNEFASYAYARVTGTRFDWAYDRANGQVDTTWTLTTTPLKGSQTNTLQGWLPHHYRTTTNTLAFKPYTYLTPRGIMKVAAGTQFQLNYNFHGIAPELPAPHLNNVTNDYVAARLTNYLLNFAAAHPQNIGDTYYGGKEMAITAQNIGFAQQLGLTNQVAQMVASLRGELTNWYSYAPGKTNFMFARYSNWGALIGFPADFGSEAFNDNHFHYGYFALTTALLGMSDTNFLAQYGPMAKLVAKEYANWDRTDTNFPLFRTFDIWEGHSWAGGFSSGGGENQESSSEAMNSWVGLFMLGNMTGDDAMTAAGAMGYATESAAVNEYWQDMYRTNLPASYGKGMTGILGSGGISYATYFNGDPAWIHAIQWVPANHWNRYLARNKTFANWQLTNLWAERITASQYGINGFSLTDSNNATALGGYLGNYVLGFQMLFDPAGVAAQMDAGYASNSGIATDNTYSSVTYYLTHSLSGLGDPDPNYYTSLPTSEVYYNAATGIRTAILYNPAPTNQIVTLYNQGTAVTTLNASAQVLTVTTPGYTNRATLSLQPGAQVNWPTTAGYTYEPQSATNHVTWLDLIAPLTGDGTTNVLFVAGSNAALAGYRVLEILPPTASATSLVSNGGFEFLAGSNIAGWTLGGSQSPTRTTTAHIGSYALDLAVTNTGTVPNSSQLSQTLTNGSVVPGLSYNFSFWARQISSGVSYVQNYRLSWLNASGATISAIGYNSFSGGNGTWVQVLVTNLVAPAGTTKALIEIYGTTGAVQSGYGEVLLDDIALGLNTPGTTNVLAVTAHPANQITWRSISTETYQLQASTNVSPGATWTNIGPSLPGDGSLKAVIDPAVPSAKFYRLTQQP